MTSLPSFCFYVHGDRTENSFSLRALVLVMRKELLPRQQADQSKSAKQPLLASGD
jgi:hypothetical protein